MVNEDEGKKKSKKKNNEKQDQAYEEFVDDVQADPNLRKQMKLYENSSVLKKNMTKQELDEILGDIEIEELFRELKIEEKEEKGHEGEQLQGIDDLIAKMENVKI